MEFIDFELDILINNPTALATTSEVPRHVNYQQAIDRLFSSPRIAPVTWGESRYRTRQLTSADRQMVMRSIASVSDLISQYVVPNVVGDVPFELIDIQIDQIEFGCIKLKAWAAVKVLGVITTIAAGASTFYVNHLGADESNIEITCNVSVTTPRNVGFHLRKMAERSPEELFSMDKDCVRMKQRALKFLNYYNGSIDGRFGDQSATAERRFAESQGISQTDTVAIYRRLSKFLVEFGPGE